MSRLSRGNVPSVPRYVPSVPRTFCPLNWNFHISRPKRPGCSWDVPNLSLGRFRGIPTTKFLYVMKQERGVLAKGVSAESSVTPKETRNIRGLLAPSSTFGTQSAKAKRGVYFAKPPSKSPLVLVPDYVIFFIRFFLFPNQGPRRRDIPDPDHGMSQTGRLGKATFSAVLDREWLGCPASLAGTSGFWVRTWGSWKALV